MTVFSNIDKNRIRETSRRWKSNDKVMRLREREFNLARATLT